MSHPNQQEHHNHMLEILFGKLYKGDFSVIDPQEVPDIIAFGDEFNEELYNIAITANKEGIDKFEETIEKFNGKNSVLPKIHNQYRKGMGDMTLPEGFGAKELQQLNDVMTAMSYNLETVQEKMKILTRGEDLDDRPNTVNFLKIHDMLKKTVTANKSNLQEVTDRHFPKETQHPLANPGLDRPDLGKVIQGQPRLQPRLNEKEYE